VPTAQAGKNKMFKPKFAITPKINKAVVEIERVRGFLDAVKLITDGGSLREGQADYYC